MSWNYRVIRHGGWFGIHEVHYDDAGNIIGYTENPEIAGESPEDIAGTLRLQLQAAEFAPLRAKDKRVLDEDELPKDDEGSGA